MINNILFNNVIHVLSEIQIETSRALDELHSLGSTCSQRTLFNLSSVFIPELSIHKKGGQNGT